MIELAAVDGSTLTAIAGLAIGIAGSIAAFVRLPQERRTSIVGAQDTVIENLVEEVDRYKRERDEETARLRAYYEGRLADMQRSIDEEKAKLENKIAELSAKLERRLPPE